MHSDEIEIKFAAFEGWNPGLHDAACFHAADPGDFLVAEYLGRTVGCIAAVSYAGCPDRPMRLEAGLALSPVGTA